jgi:hypothetical protein
MNVFPALPSSSALGTTPLEHLEYFAYESGGGETCGDVRVNVRPGGTRRGQGREGSDRAMRASAGHAVRAQEGGMAPQRVWDNRL